MTTAFKTAAVAFAFAAFTLSSTEAFVLSGRDSQIRQGSFFSKTPTVAVNPIEQLSCKQSLFTEQNLFQKQKAPSVSEVEQIDDGVQLAINPFYGAVWLGLVTFGFLLAPGTLNGPDDAQMLETFINDPLNGGDYNRLWFVIWNYFTVVPAILASLMLPNVKENQWLSATPFVLGSAFFGYFALGPYMTLRDSMKISAENSNGKEFGFVTKNILDNRIFGAVLALLAIEIPFTTGLTEALGNDASGVFAGFWDLISSSRFTSVAVADIIIMILLSAVLIYEDLKNRRGGIEEPNDKLLAASTLAAPGIGAAIYLALRPKKVE